MDGERTEPGQPGPDDGLEVLEERKLLEDVDVPPEALETGRETMPREALVDMISRGDPGAIVVDAADGPRTIPRGGDQAPIRSLIGKAVSRRRNGASANGQ